MSKGFLERTGHDLQSVSGMVNMLGLYVDVRRKTLQRIFVKWRIKSYGFILQRPLIEKNIRSMFVLNYFVFRQKISQQAILLTGVTPGGCFKSSRIFELSGSLIDRRGVASVAPYGFFPLFVDGFLTNLPHINLAIVWSLGAFACSRLKFNFWKKFRSRTLSRGEITLLSSGWTLIGSEFSSSNFNRS